MQENFMIFGPKRMEFQQIYVRIPEFSLKIKTLTFQYALLKVILKSCSVPDRLPKVIHLLGMWGFLKSLSSLILLMFALKIECWCLKDTQE